MKHKTIVRIVVKLLGVYLVATGLPNAVMTFANVIVYALVPDGNAVATGFSPSGQWRWWMPNVAMMVTQIGLGTYLLLGGAWIINLIVPSNRAYCPDCGYELRRPIAPQCPECGVVLPSSVTHVNEPPRER